jgi:hypothetical protein
VFREALTLHGARGFDALADGFGAFAAVLAAEGFVFDERHFDMEVDAVEKWPADALAVFGDHRRTAAAFAFQITVEAARSGV